MDSRDIEKWRVELDSYAHVEDGVEYWLARDLMEPLGYTQWRNFETAVKRSMASCGTNKMPVAAHFAEASKMVDAGIAKRAVKDYKLTRYACYLIAQKRRPKQARNRARTGVLRRAGGRCGTSRLARCAGKCLRIYSAPRPFGFDPMRGQQKRRPTYADRLNMLWWAVRGSACCAGGRCGASRLARCAGKCLRISSAPRPDGFDPMKWQQKR